jgi:hypothetical protein
MSRAKTTPQNIEGIYKKIHALTFDLKRVHFFYLYGVGYVVESYEISQRNQGLLDGGHGFYISAYGHGVVKSYVFDDFEWSELEVEKVC